MAARTGPASVPAAVKEVRSRVDRWRRTRSTRGPMPEPLWQAATRLARTHGVSPVARALGLDYCSLKRRDVRAGKKRSAVAAPAFVELDVAPSSASPECVIEIEHRRGEKLTVRLRGQKSLDVLALVKAFRTGRG